nr:hypothetical protein [Bacteroidota bacterium]
RNIDNNDYVTDSTWCWVRSRGVELRSFNVVETEDKGFLALCYNHHHIHCNDYYQKVDSGYFSHYYTHTFANLDSSENPNRHYIDKFVFLPPEETWFPYPIFNKKNYPYHDIIKERAAMNNFTYNVYNNNTTDNIDCPKGNYVLVKTDSLGNVLWKRGFGNYSYCYENQSYGNIIKLANDKYLVFIRNFNEFGPFSCFYILNNKGETKRQLNTKIPYLNIELAADSGYYLGLNIDNTKFDKDLNVVWKSASLNWIGGSTFACTIDTGLILSSRACFQYNIFKIDKHGNDFPKNFSINTKEIKHGIRFTINYDNSFCNSYLEIKRVGGKKLPDKVLQYDYENSFYRRYPKKKPKSELIEKDIEVGIGGVIDLNCPDQLTTLYINHPKGYPIKGSLRFEPCVKDVTFYKIGYGMPIYPFKNIEIHCMTPGKYKYSYYYSYYNNKTKKYKKEVITGKFIIK